MREQRKGDSWTGGQHEGCKLGTKKENLAQDLARGGETWGDAEVVYSAARRARRSASEGPTRGAERVQSSRGPVVRLAGNPIA